MTFESFDEPHPVAADWEVQPRFALEPTSQQVPVTPSGVEVDEQLDDRGIEGERPLLDGLVEP